MAFQETFKAPSDPTRRAILDEITGWIAGLKGTTKEKIMNNW